MRYLTAADILKQQGARQARRYEAFEIILENVYKKIQKCIQVTRNVFSCFFEVPEFIIGYPLYDLNECIQYIVKILISKGFAIQYMFPRILFVSWSPKPNATLPMPMPMSGHETYGSHGSHETHETHGAPNQTRVKTTRNITTRQHQLQQSQQSQQRAKQQQQYVPHVQIQHDDGKKIFIQKSNTGKKTSGKFVLDLS
jgi:hypothetical protein